MNASSAQSLGSTSTSLVDLAREGDATAWPKLVSLYGPLIYHWARKSDLQPADAADVVQDVLRTVATSLRSYDHQRPGSSFRGWLRTITRSRIVDLVRRRGDALARGGTTVQGQLQNVAESISDADTNSLPDSPRLQRVHAALEAVRAETKEHTWQAFWRTTVEGHSTAEVMASLNMNSGAVLEAKSRVLRKLRKLLAASSDLDSESA